MTAILTPTEALDRYEGRWALGAFAATPALPDASAWHQTERARKIVADMMRLDALSRELDDRWALDRGLSTVWWNIGTLDRIVKAGKPVRYETQGVLGELLSELEAMRDDAIDAARLAAFPASYHSHADEFDGYSDAVGDHLDTVATALEWAA
jgi:hypothetical protein